MIFFIFINGSQGAFLLIPQKSVQKKQAFEMKPVTSENPRAVQGGLGRRPILKSCPPGPPRKTFV
jgi:hypothetical protein